MLKIWKNIQYQLSRSFDEQINNLVEDLHNNIYKIDHDDVVFMMGGGNDLTSFNNISHANEMATDIRN